MNYADARFAMEQAINRLTGLRCGFDTCLSYTPAEIDADFARRHALTLSASRGAGYWLWKPYVVARTLAGLEEGDLLFYADAGTHFVNPIEPMIALLEQHRLDLLILGEGFTEAHYCKRDAFVLMEADEPAFVQSPQRFCSGFLLRKSPWSEAFVARYLHFAEDTRILTDAPNSLGLPNYPGFVVHRHDQSIFSLLSKLDDVPVVARDLIVEGMPVRDQQIVNHTRGHCDPREVIRYLLLQGLLSVSDLGSLTQHPSVPQAPPL